MECFGIMGGATEERRPSVLLAALPESSTLTCFSCSLAGVTSWFFFFLMFIYFHLFERTKERGGERPKLGNRNPSMFSHLQALELSFAF